MRRSEIQSWDVLYAITGHKIISSESSITCDRSQISSEPFKQGHTKRINPKFATESEFNHICVLQYTYVTFAEIWSNNFCGAVAVHTSRMLMSEKRSIVSVLRTHPFTDWISHFCCKCWLHSLDLIWPCLSDSDVICGSKRHLKCLRNFRASWPWVTTDKLWNERTLSTSWDQS